MHTWQWKGGEWEDDALVTMGIRPREHCAEVVLVHDRFRDGEEANGHAEGWAESLEKLAELLGSTSRIGSIVESMKEWISECRRDGYNGNGNRQGG